MVTDIIGVKLATSVMGPFIVIVAELLDPVYDPEPLPVHPLKEYPLLCVA